MSRKKTAQLVSLEIKILHPYLVISSPEWTIQLSAGDLRLKSNQDGAVTTQSVGKAVLTLFSEVQKRRADSALKHQSSLKYPQYGVQKSRLLEKSEFLPIQTVAEILDVSIGTVRRLSSRQILKPQRTPGGHRRFHVTDVVRLLEAQSQTSGVIRDYWQVPYLE